MFVDFLEALLYLEISKFCVIQQRIKCIGYVDLTVEAREENSKA